MAQDVITIETGLSKESAIKRISELTGTQTLELFTPFGGSVKGDTFRLYRSGLFNHPFIPIAAGCVKRTTKHSVIELTFVTPWLGHAAMLTTLAVYGSSSLPLSWEVVLVIAFIWVLLLAAHTKEKKCLLKH